MTATTRIERAADRTLARALVRARSFGFRIDGWPPSKSNLYEIVTPFQRGGEAGHPTLKLTQPAEEYVALARLAIMSALSAQHLAVAWELPPGHKRKLAPINPVFGADVEVDVTIHLYEPTRSRADSDGVLKLLLDVVTECGVWCDDNQVADIHVRRHLTPDAGDHVDVVICQREQPARWLANPTGRMTVRARASRSATAMRRRTRTRIST